MMAASQCRVFASLLLLSLTSGKVRKPNKQNSTHAGATQALRSDPELCRQNSTMCGKMGSNSTAGCQLLFADIGANTGQSLHQWYHSLDNGRGMKEFARVASWRNRRNYCADVFEANPSFNKYLQYEAHYHRQRGKHVQLYLQTPVSADGGMVEFFDMGFMVNGGGTLSFKSIPKRYDTAAGKIKRLPSISLVEYVRAFAGEHLVLKIDVENYEFKLLRALIASGVLCQKPHRTDLLIEWHLPRASGDVLDAKVERLPADASTTKAMLLWMLDIPACSKVRHHEWW